MTSRDVLLLVLQMIFVADLQCVKRIRFSLFLAEAAELVTRFCERHWRQHAPLSASARASPHRLA